MSNFVQMTDQVEISIPDEVEELFNVRRDGLPEVIAINTGLLSFPIIRFFLGTYAYH
jgi:hypothetical protein